MKIQHASRLRRVENWRQFFLLPISVLVLSACAHAPDQGYLPCKAATAYSSDHAFQSDNKVAWPENKWWMRYNDAQLNRLMEMKPFVILRRIKNAAAPIAKPEGLAQQTGAAVRLQGAWRYRPLKPRSVINIRRMRHRKLE